MGCGCQAGKKEQFCGSCCERRKLHRARLTMLARMAKNRCSNCHRSMGCHVLVFKKLYCPRR